MSTIVLPGPFIEQTSDPKPIRWTQEQYYRLGELGFFQGQRVELIDGAIQVKSPQNGPHSMTIVLGHDALRIAFGAAFHVRVQLPLVLGATFDPEPDLEVISGHARQYPTHPTSAVLVVEVSDSTLAYDTQEKASLYAASGIVDYWVVDINNRQVIVFRDPQSDATQQFGFAYRLVQRLQSGNSIAPLAAPNSLVAVIDLLP